jgi:CheY-like chemotaxis protein
MVRVASGDECIAYVEGSGPFSNRVEYPAPKLILLDLKMPRKDGFEVLQWRQSAVDQASLPVIVFSSSCLEADIRLAYRLGANSYVIKPTAPERLDAMVKALDVWWVDFNATVAPTAYKGSFNRLPKVERVTPNALVLFFRRAQRVLKTSRSTPVRVTRLCETQ